MNTEFVYFLNFPGRKFKVLGFQFLMHLLSFTEIQGVNYWRVLELEFPFLLSLAS